MFVLRQFNARINTTYRSMTVICLMLLLAIGITASSVGLNNTVEQMTAEQAPRTWSCSSTRSRRERWTSPPCWRRGL